MLKGEHTLAEFAASMNADVDAVVASVNRFRHTYQGGLAPVGPEHRMFSAGVAAAYYFDLSESRRMLERV